MEFDEGRIYTAVNADRLHTGDLVVAANSVRKLKEKVGHNDEPVVLHGIREDDFVDRFELCMAGLGEVGFALVYLICPARNAEAYSAWHDGRPVKQGSGLSGILEPGRDAEPDWVAYDYRVPLEDPFRELKEAYAAGKVIQYNLDGHGWTDWDNPTWDGEPQDYRVKPEQRYRPFNDVDELIATWAKMMGYPAKVNTMPLIWVKQKDTERIACITEFAVYAVTIGGEVNRIGFRNMFDDFTFLDGSCIGVACE